MKKNLYYLFTRYKWQVLINLIWLALYFFVTQQYGLPTKDLMFYTPDSKSYLSVGVYFFEGHPTESTLYRPFLYPILLKSLLILGDVRVVWIFQALLWLLTLNLLLHTGYMFSFGQYLITDPKILSHNLRYSSMSHFPVNHYIISLLCKVLI